MTGCLYSLSIIMNLLLDLWEKVKCAGSEHKNSINFLSGMRLIVGKLELLLKRFQLLDYSFEI